ncbi:hypothetical protein E2C01_089807 [Portunus trituberculatus]|uniref:Uncharacterized protein n=1 Tax=Portunus trituberculatus TaxID=210409 RepID=A0A5B7JIH7_PORTR|nr:hypothetical protein [Portunus trituberculatus]
MQFQRASSIQPRVFAWTRAFLYDLKNNRYQRSRLHAPNDKLIHKFKLSYTSNKLGSNCSKKGFQLRPLDSGASATGSTAVQVVKLER